ncbi:MAG: ATP-binding protein [Chloroflexi bacterium]|nr:MAG: ATP-binding protein [Chloroflexota bacterium]
MPRPARRSGNLPADATSFIGRRPELAELRRKLASARLVSLVGPGGVGKTRLAIRIATGSHVDIAGCILSAAKQETARCDPHT